MEKVEEIELLEDAQVIERTFSFGEREFPPFGDVRRAIFRYVIKDAVIHLESGLANVCGGFLIEELIGSHTGVFGGGTAAHEYHATLKKTRRFEGYWAVMPVPRFYFHFIAQTLPTLLRALQHEKIQGIIASRNMPNWAVEVLGSLGVQVVYLSNETVEIEKYVCCSVPQITSVSDVALLRKEFSSNLSVSGSNLAFIGRGNRNRNLGALEGAIAEMVKDHGGFLVEPETLSWEQELEIFSSVDRLILVAGSASANVTWMRPGTKVFVLQSYDAFSTQIDKSQYAAAGVSCYLFNTDQSNEMSAELEAELVRFICE